MCCYAFGIHKHKLIAFVFILNSNFYTLPKRPSQYVNQNIYQLFSKWFFTISNDSFAG